MLDFVIASEYDAERFAQYRAFLDQAEPSVRKLIVSAQKLALPAPWENIVLDAPVTAARCFNAASAAAGAAGVIWMDQGTRFCRGGVVRDVARIFERNAGVGILSSQFVGDVEGMAPQQSNQHQVDGVALVPGAVSFDCVAVTRRVLDLAGKREDSDVSGERYCAAVRSCGYFVAVTSEIVARRFASKSAFPIPSDQFTDAVTLVTPTGARQQAFSVCQKLVFRQAQAWPGKMQWVVIDDGEVDTEVDESFPGELTVFRPEPRWHTGMNTQARNLVAAAQLVKYDKILFIEDDDWYAPDYASVMAARLNRFDAVGEVPAHYYYLPSRRYLLLSNTKHASLCQTAIRTSLLPKLIDICSSSSQKEYIDIRLWEGLGARGGLFCSRRCVGIKGMPGRAGIGIGHRPEGLSAWQRDDDLSVLRSWIGADVQFYYV